MSRAHICIDGRVKTEITDDCTFDCKQKLVFNNLSKTEIDTLDTYLWHLITHLKSIKRKLDIYEKSSQQEFDNNLVICKYSHICKDIDNACKHKVPHMREARECSINCFCDIIHESGVSCIPIKKKERIARKQIIDRPIEDLLP